MNVQGAYNPKRARGMQGQQLRRTKSTPFPPKNFLPSKHTRRRFFRFKPWHGDVHQDGHPLFYAHRMVRWCVGKRRQRPFCSDHNTPTPCTDYEVLTWVLPTCVLDEECSNWNSSKDECRAVLIKYTASLVHIPKFGQFQTWNVVPI